MSAAPFLSICIPTYNRAALLRRSLDSILAQVNGVPGVEVVISDNASTDQTGEVGAEYERRFPTLRYTRNSVNVGFDGNIVACVEKARGEYVAFFSDDDLTHGDTFLSLLKQLREVRPAIAYICHTPFLNDDTTRLLFQPQGVRRIMQSGAEFILDYGLGFISALIVRKEYALEFTGKVVPGRGTAHLEIALRIALSKPGPFLFDGNLTVLSKYDYECGYDILRFGPMNVTKLFEELNHEGLLSAKDLAAHKRRSLKNLPRSIVNNRLRGGAGIVRPEELRRLYGQDPLFYLLIYPLALVPPSVVRALGFPARQVMRWFRKVRFSSRTRST